MRFLVALSTRSNDGQSCSNRVLIFALARERLDQESVLEKAKQLGFVPD
jgi:hypothetical protein